MNIEIIYQGHPLRKYRYEGRLYVETPAEGEYQIKLVNDRSSRRLFVVSVDGINVVDGSEASFDGPGYVLGPWESTIIKGWRRSDSKVAAFTFKPQEESLAAKTGRGTANTGVIGIAVFEEKTVPKPAIIPYIVYPNIYINPPHPYYCGPVITNTATGFAGQGPVVTSSSGAYGVGDSVDLGTDYGKEVQMFTTMTSFERASAQPYGVETLYYGTREKLIEWGVPVATPPEANPFPASSGPFVAPPPGWAG